MTTIAIVDDHQLLAETLQHGLRRRGLQTVVLSPQEVLPWPVRPDESGASTGSAGPSLLDRLLDLHPDMVLLDLDLGPAGTSLPLIAPLVAAGVRVLMVTGVTERLRIAEALELGAIGYQPKALGFDALVDKACLAATSSGPLDPAGHRALRLELTAHRVEQDREWAPFRQLTDREQATLRELGNGRAVKDIADAWFVSEATVRSHVRSILTKLGATSQLQAVATASRRGWLDRTGR